MHRRAECGAFCNNFHQAVCAHSTSTRSAVHSAATFTKRLVFTRHLHEAPRIQCEWIDTLVRSDTSCTQATTQRQIVDTCLGKLRRATHRRTASAHSTLTQSAALCTPMHASNDLLPCRAALNTVPRSRPKCKHINCNDACVCECLTHRMSIDSLNQLDLHWHIIVERVHI